MNGALIWIGLCTLGFAGILPPTLVVILLWPERIPRERNVDDLLRQ